MLDSQKFMVGGQSLVNRTKQWIPDVNSLCVSLLWEVLLIIANIFSIYTCLQKSAPNELNHAFNITVTLARVVIHVATPIGKSDSSLWDTHRPTW